MISFKGRMFHYFLKYRHLFKGKLKADVIDTSTDITALRRESDEMASKLMKPIADVIYEATDYDGFYAEWVRIEGSAKDKVILYFHGGGFVMGNARSHRNIVGNFCKRTGYDALVFDYHLAPEHPSPAATLDSVAIYKWLLAQGFTSDRILFAGDSAGAGIALSTLLMLKDQGLDLPTACIAISPCTDMTLSGESHISRLKKDPCTPKGASETYTKYYVGSGDPMNPYASPLFGDLRGLPPLLIQVGDNETLLDDSARFAEKAKIAGVDVTLEIAPGMFHCFPLLAPMFKEADEAMDSICRFTRKHLG